MERLINIIFCTLLVALPFFGFASSYSPVMDSLITELRQHPEKDEKRADLLNELTYYLLDYKDGRDTLELLVNEALELSRSLDYPIGIAQALIKKGLIQNKDGHFLESIDTYYEAIPLFLEAGEYGRTLVCYLNAGNSYADHGDYDKASGEYEKALVVADSTGEKDKMAGIMNNIGTIYYTQGDYLKANEYFIQSVNVLEELKDSIKLSTSYANVGIMYYIQKDVKNAEKYILKSYNLYKTQNNAAGMAGQLMNLGSLYFENNRDKEALPKFHEALELFQNVNNVHGIGECYTQLGAAYTRLEQPAKALEYYSKSIRIMEEIEDPRGMAVNYKERARLNKKLEKYDLAEQDAKRSIAICNELQLPKIKQDGYLILSEVYDKKGQHELALDYHRKFLAIKDSLFNEEKHKQVAELEAQYESAKKEKEIALLSKERELNRLELEKKQANIQRQNTILFALGGGVLLISLLVFIIWKRYNEKKQSNILLGRQNEEIARQNKEIKDSIRYAQRIQNAIIPPDKVVEKHLPGSFVFYRAKDIVSGDFYWLYPLPDGRILFSVIDCTGHGVPGAMMSVIGFNYLNQCVNEYQLTEPAAILNRLNVLVTETLHQHEDRHVEDGMDLALCLYDPKSSKLEYAGAHNPLVIIRSGEVIEHKANRMAIGTASDSSPSFRNYKIELQSGDMIYLFSDGYIDQFGGAQGKRFMKKRFKELLANLASSPTAAQKTQLIDTFEQWKGALEQLDDVCVMGLKI